MVHRREARADQTKRRTTSALPRGTPDAGKSLAVQVFAQVRRGFQVRTTSCGTAGSPTRPLATKVKRTSAPSRRAAHRRRGRAPSGVEPQEHPQCPEALASPASLRALTSARLRWRDSGATALRIVTFSHTPGGRIAPVTTNMPSVRGTGGWQAVRSSAEGTIVFQKRLSTSLTASRTRLPGPGLRLARSSRRPAGRAQRHNQRKPGTGALRRRGSPERRAPVLGQGRQRG